MVTFAIVAWCTLLALAPPRRTMALGLISFLFGFVLNELPFPAFCYLLVSTLLAIGPGGLDSSADLAVVGLAAATAAGLVIVARGLFAGRLRAASSNPVIYAELLADSTASTGSIRCASIAPSTGSRHSSPGFDHAS
ncbi:MAG: hypothetical protein ACRDOK_01425 [Streptosporangiaceae bacterium]